MESLRIRRPATKTTGSPPAAPGGGDSGNTYLARLVKLIPGEVIALYLTFKTQAAAFLGIWSVICLGLVVLVRIIATREPGKGPQYCAVGVAAGSFFLWVYAMGGYFFTLQLPANGISIGIGVWTFLVPLFYKGD